MYILDYLYIHMSIIQYINIYICLYLHYMNIYITYMHIWDEFIHIPLIPIQVIILLLSCLRANFTISQLWILQKFCKLIAWHWSWLESLHHGNCQTLPSTCLIYNLQLKHPSCFWTTDQDFLARYLSAHWLHLVSINSRVRSLIILSPHFCFYSWCSPYN